MVEAIGEVFSDAKYQRCTVHFYWNVFSVVPKQKVKEVAKMLKAIHAQEDKEAALEKADEVLLFTGGLVSNTIIHYTEGAGRTSGSFSLLKTSTTA